MDKKGQAVKIGLVVAASIFALVMVMIYDARIVLNQSFKEEYRTCLDQLERVKDSCPAADCNCGASGLVWGILGLLLYAGGVLLFFKLLKDRENLMEKNAELDRRLKELKAKRR